MTFRTMRESDIQFTSKKKSQNLGNSSEKRQTNTVSVKKTKSTGQLLAITSERLKNKHFLQILY